MIMRYFYIFLFLTLSSWSWAQSLSNNYDRYEQMAERVIVQDKYITSKNMPQGYKFDRELGLVINNKIHGKVIHRNYNGGLYETRAVKSPNGDYLLMFPDGGHYGSAGQSHKKINNMVAYRSKDMGNTWEGPTVAFDIDYNQHGFIPFIPKGTNRLYAFGTQPIRYSYNAEGGLQENSPIGYRYSDDDGHSWSEVRLIRPENDPDFLGMSVMRMCETDNGTWLLGSHEADWSYKPLLTRQYILRSDDKGKTWEVVPGKRHGGWHASCYGRMDEGRPINVGNGEIFFMTRTPEGHLWGSRSVDDGKTWSEFEPTSLVHPDAPPMLFKLSNGKTLIAFHHNISRMKTADLTIGSQHLDRSELWFSLSEDGGRTWSDSKFLLANAFKPALEGPWKDYNTSYCDMFVDEGKIHLLMPHRWSRALYLTIEENELETFSTKKELFSNIKN